jgi:hypothetical protein
MELTRMYCGFHRLDHGLDAVERPVQVDVDDLVPLVHIELSELTERDDAGVVDQYIELAEVVDRGGHRGVPLFGLGDVEVDVACGLANLVGEFFAVIVENVADHDLGALGDQCASVGSAHPPSATADQCNFSVHASHDASRYRSGLAN